MVLCILAATLIVLIFSFRIALVSGEKIKHRTSGNFYGFLFGGNRLYKSVFSNFGSYITLTTFLCGMFFSGYKYGYPIFIPITTGLLLTIFFLFLCKSIPFCDKDQLPYYTISWFIYRRLGGNAFFLYLIVIILFFLSLMVSELTILKYYFQKILGDKSALYYIPLIFIAVVCVEYVWIGGFRGVLNTDFYQVCIVLTWIVFTLALANGGAWKAPDFNEILKSNGGALKIYTTSISLDSFITYFSLSLCMFALFLCTNEIWTKSIGTLKKDRAASIIYTSLFILVGTIPLVILGNYLRNSYDTIKNPFVAVNDIIIQTLNYHYAYSLIAFMAIVAIATTTIDSAVLMILQNIQMIFRRNKVKRGILNKNIFEISISNSFIGRLLYNIFHISNIRYYIIILALIFTFFSNFFFVFLFIRSIFIALVCLLIIIISSVIDFYLDRPEDNNIFLRFLSKLFSMLLQWKNFSWIPVMLSIVSGWLLFSYPPDIIMNYVSNKFVYIVLYSIPLYIFYNAIGNTIEWSIKKKRPKG